MGGEGLDRLGRALFDACVDRNPNQIVAIFALRSPLSTGALLANEARLGKSIQAGLVHCQNWAESGLGDDGCIDKMFLKLTN